MKWDLAISKIGNALARDLEVEVRYHRKWTRNSNELDKYGQVESISEYKYGGKVCKAVVLHYDIIEEGNYIIDEVNTLKESSL